MNTTLDALFERIANAFTSAIHLHCCEANDQITRDSIASLVSNELSDILAAGLITQYEVTCDVSNNTAEVIDAGNVALRTSLTLPNETIARVLDFIACRKPATFSSLTKDNNGN